jgi:hypothetical protein
MLKKLLAVVGTAALTLGLVAVVAGPASAHDHAISASCETGLSVNLVSYANDNTIKVVVDGATVTDQSFDATFDQTYPFVAGQPTHSYQVVITASDKPQYNYDSGLVTVNDCQPKVTPAQVTPTDAVCVSAGVVGDGGYVIPADQTGVEYQRFDSASNSWIKVASGSHAAPVGSLVQIRAVGIGGYELTGTTSWPLTIHGPDASTCLSDSVAVAPLFTPAVCTTTPGTSTDNTYTIYATTGAHFQVKVGDGEFFDQLPGTYSVGTAASTVTIQALHDTNYQLSGQTTFPKEFSAAPSCLMTVVPTASSAPAVCDTAHPGSPTSGSYTLGAVTGVLYTVSTNGGSSVPVAAGTYPAAVGTDIQVSATADTAHGYSVAGTPSWHFTFVSPGTCLDDAKWIQPAATSQSCLPDGSGGGLGQLGGAVAADTLTQAFITIPDTVGVRYFINGAAHAAGDVTLSPGSYQVTAVATSGYQLAAGYPVGGWTEVLTSAEPCGQLITHPLVLPSAFADPITCLAGGTYTLGNDLNDSAAIIWTVNGSTVAAGPYTITAPGTYKVHAEANGPSYGLESGATQDWTFTFTAPAGCDLKTLALTGSSPMGWIVLGYFMLIAGLVLVAVRYVRRRPEQS